MPFTMPSWYVTSTSLSLNHAYPVYTHTKLETSLSFQIRGKTGAASVC
jgi:hypothetical protein